MKLCIDGIIVVEGKSDVAFLNEFIEVEFVTTNGSEISAKTIDYLKNASKTRTIFVLTDPDSPGKRIRDILDQNIDGLNHCFVSKEKAIKKNKVGVAESTKEEVLKSLQNPVISKSNPKGSLTMNDLLSLNLIGSENSTELRNKVANELHLGFCNAKTLLKRLNFMNISQEEIRRIL